MYLFVFFIISSRQQYTQNKRESTTMSDKSLSCKTIRWFKLTATDSSPNKRKVYYSIMLIGFKFKGKKTVHSLHWYISDIEKTPQQL